MRVNNDESAETPKDDGIGIGQAQEEVTQTQTRMQLGKQDSKKDIFAILYRTVSTLCARALASMPSVYTHGWPFVVYSIFDYAHGWG